MAISPRTAIVFNIAAIVVAASAVGAVVRSWVVKPSVAPCETRYTNVLAFRLDREGKTLTAVDLQGRAGGRDIGLGHNVNIGPVPGAPKPLAMKVSLPAGSGVPDAAAARVGGMAFPWEPANIRRMPPPASPTTSCSPIPMTPPTTACFPGCRAPPTMAHSAS